MKLIYDNLEHAYDELYDYVLLNGQRNNVEGHKAVNHHAFYLNEPTSTDVPVWATKYREVACKDILEIPREVKAFEDITEVLRKNTLAVYTLTSLHPAINNYSRVLLYHVKGTLAAQCDLLLAGITEDLPTTHFFVSYLLQRMSKAVKASIGHLYYNVGMLYIDKKHEYRKFEYYKKYGTNAAKENPNENIYY